MRTTAILLIAAACGPGFSQEKSFLEMLPERENAYSAEELLETWGWLVGEQFDLRGLDLTREEAEAIAKGLTDYAVGQEAPTDLRTSIEQAQEFLALREKRVFENQLAENQAAEKAFFRELDAKAGARSLATGLRFEILEPGSGTKPRASDWVRVHYEGRFLDGEVFDSSHRRGEPSEFRLDEVIRAWTQGLPLIGEGGKIKLYAPAELGYGRYGRGGVPPGAALIFEVDLLEVIGPENPDAADGADSPPGVPAEEGR